MSQHLTQDLAREFGDDLIIELGPCQIDTLDALRLDIDLMIKAGAITPDEVRHLMRSMPPLPGGHGSKPIMVSGFSQVGDEAPCKTNVGRAALASPPKRGPTSARKD